MRSMKRQMHSVKFPIHRDLAGFDFSVSSGDCKLMTTLADASFMDVAHNAILAGGPCAGKTHLAAATGIPVITCHGKRVRPYSTIDPVKALEKGRANGQAGRTATSHAAHGLGEARKAPAQTSRCVKGKSFRGTPSTASLSINPTMRRPATQATPCT